MEIMKYFPFFDSVKNPVSAAAVSDAYNNAGYNLLVLEITGPSAITAKVQGCVNVLDANLIQKSDAQCTFSDLKIMDKSYNMIDSITAAGIYYISISGCSKVRVNVTAITGTATIVGAMEA